MEHAVRVMVDLGLSYKQLLSPEGSYVYQIEPDIEHLSKFSGELFHNIVDCTKKYKFHEMNDLQVESFEYDANTKS